MRDGLAFLVEVEIESPGNLKPGMIVSTRIGTPREALSLPLTAVQRGEQSGHYSVYEVAERDGKPVAVRRSIDLDGIADDRVLLRGDNAAAIAPGTTIVVDGAERLHDGQAVKVLNGPTQLASVPKIPPIQ
ncbi:MAG: hypothetical protein U0794_22715 [Isosphaeraceae bacterium]